MFTGDQLGAIFAGSCLDNYLATGEPLGKVLSLTTYFQKKQHNLYFSDKLAMVASTVSSKLIEAMALKEGFRFEETLTGMKAGRFMICID